MLVQDQIKLRMEELRLTVQDVAKRVGVSNQTIRHWLSGRNSVGKRHIATVERALGPNWKIDFAGEYETPIAATAPAPSRAAAPAPVSAPTPGLTAPDLRQLDVELFLLIAELSPDLKQQLHTLVRTMVEKCRRSSGSGSGAGGGLASADASAFGGVRHSTSRPQFAAR